MLNDLPPDVTPAVVAREGTSGRLAALQDAADRDPLTGLLNRRGFDIAAADRDMYQRRMLRRLRARDDRTGG